jgi:WD40 repeat protein
MLCVVLVWTARGQQAAPPTAVALPPGAVARLGSVHFWHGTPIRALAFAPGERLLASWGQDDRICVWETATGKLVRSLTVPRKPVPDDEGPFGKGKKGKGGFGTSSLYADLAGDSFRGPRLTFSTDGKLLGAADTDGQRYRVWDTTTGKELHQVPFPVKVTTPEDDLGFPKALARQLTQKAAGPCVLSGDGRLLALGGKENAIIVWDLGKGAERCRLQGHTGPVLTVAFAADSKTLLSAGADHMLRLWDVTTGKQLRTFQGHRAPVKDVAFLADGRRLLSASADGTLRLWDRDSGMALRHLRWLPAAAGAKGKSPDVRLWHDGGKQVGCLFTLNPATAAGSLALARATTKGPADIFVTYDSATGKELRRAVLVRAQQAAVLAVGLTRPLLARGRASTHIALLTLETGEPLPRSELGGAAVADVALTGDHLAVVQRGSMDVQLWDWRAARPGHRLEGHTGQPSLARFALDGKALVSWSAMATDASVSRWDVASGQEQGRGNGEDEGPNLGVAPGSFAEFVLGRRGVAPPPRPEVTLDGRLVALGGQGGMLRVVDLVANKEVAAPDYSLWKGRGLVGFTPDRRALVVCDVTEQDNTGMRPKAAKKETPPDFGTSVRVLDLKSGVLGAKVGGRTHNFFARRLVVTERYALLACTQGLVRVLDLTTGEELRTVGEGPPAAALDPLDFDGWGGMGGGPSSRVVDRSPQFAVSPDGRTVAVLHPEDNSVRLWEVATNGPRGHLKGHAGPITCLCFSTDGRHLVTGSQDGTVLIWAVMTRARPEPTGQQLEALWADLGGDSVKGLQAAQRLTASPAAVKMLGARLKSVPPLDEERVRQLVRDLDDRLFTKRRRAEKELTELGEGAARALGEALKGNLSTEARQRVEATLKLGRSGMLAGERLREVRAVEVLEAVGSAEALAVLRQLAGGAAEARLTREARAALERASLRNGGR